MKKPVEDARYWEFRRKVENLVFDPIRRGGRTEDEILAELERMSQRDSEALRAGGQVEKLLYDLGNTEVTTGVLYRWDRIQGHEYLDVEGLGRYLIKRDYKGAHHFRAFLNNERTTFLGKTIDEVKVQVERYLNSCVNRGVMVKGDFMNKAEVIAAVEAVEATDIAGCTEIAGALVELGVILDDGTNFEPNWTVLSEYPESVREFVSGIVWTNVEHQGGKS